ncbi:unnamed protein product [Prorocentrum cordatum]|uniref:Uncharacterized protein n=1 Tax=Prorocentrum cordatum TaxID=2364126 RepID=A0ABN9TT50_9DINO|nr:unnamed protein product [Polarella glacialis]
MARSRTSTTLVLLASSFAPALPTRLTKREAHLRGADLHADQLDLPALEGPDGTAAADDEAASGTDAVDLAGRSALGALRGAEEEDSLWRDASFLVAGTQAPAGHDKGTSGPAPATTPQDAMYSDDFLTNNGDEYDDLAEKVAQQMDQTDNGGGRYIVPQDEAKEIFLPPTTTEPAPLPPTKSPPSSTEGAGAATDSPVESSSDPAGVAPPPAAHSEKGESAEPDLSEEASSDPGGEEDKIEDSVKDEEKQVEDEESAAEAPDAEQASTGTAADEEAAASGEETAAEGADATATEPAVAAPREADQAAPAKKPSAEARVPAAPEEASADAPVPAAPVEEVEEENYGCKSWCVTHTAAWEYKCDWRNCASCSDCPSDPDEAKCHGTCSRSRALWTEKCAWIDCSGCSECDEESVAPLPPPGEDQPKSVPEATPKPKLEPPPQSPSRRVLESRSPPLQSPRSC